MADYPDVYADGIALSTSTYGMTITFTLTDPPTKPHAGDVLTNPVARLRLSRELAQQLVDMLSQSLARPAPKSEDMTKH